jgi:hypothetical protein
MKPLQLVTSKDATRPAFNYIQFKDGFLNATNGHILIKCPINEILPDSIYNQLPNECYFLANDWKNSKIDKSTIQKIENNLIECLDKKFNTMGFLKFLDLENFEKQIGRFPLTDNVWPNEDLKTEIDSIGLNPELLNDLYLANNKSNMKLTFHGKNRAITIKYENSKMIALIMPMIIENF